jgi:hypothetical protein
LTQTTSVTVRRLRREIKSILTTEAKRRGESLESLLRGLMEREAGVAHVRRHGGRGRLIAAPDGSPFFVMPSARWPAGAGRRAFLHDDDR